MKKKVWVLLQKEESIGAYGNVVETEILAIFMTKEKAEKELERIKERDDNYCDYEYEIEDYDLN